MPIHFSRNCWGVDVARRGWCHGEERLKRPRIPAPRQIRLTVPTWMRSSQSPPNQCPIRPIRPIHEKEEATGGQNQTPKRGVSWWSWKPQKTHDGMDEQFVFNRGLGDPWFKCYEPTDLGLGAPCEIPNFEVRGASLGHLWATRATLWPCPRGHHASSQTGLKVYRFFSGDEPKHLRKQKNILKLPGKIGKTH
jgi:hypothetical protein